MSNQQVKDLLKEIMKTKDPELIQMATEMLKTQGDNNKNSSKETQEESEFVMKANDEITTGGTPVDKIAKSNTFVDDGTESVDITTPSFTPTERKRTPYKPIDQTCQKCNKTLKVNPTHKREFFTCDKCLGR